MPIIPIAIYLYFCFIVAVMGQNRTMGFWGYFFASIVLTPILGLLLVLASGQNKK